jgi:hypothetical protein
MTKFLPTTQDYLGDQFCFSALRRSLSPFSDRFIHLAGDRKHKQRNGLSRLVSSLVENNSVRKKTGPHSTNMDSAGATRDYPRPVAPVFEPGGLCMSALPFRFSFPPFSFHSRHMQTCPRRSATQEIFSLRRPLRADSLPSRTPCNGPRNSAATPQPSIHPRAPSTTVSRLHRVIKRAGDGDSAALDRDPEIADAFPATSSPCFVRTSLGLFSLCGRQKLPGRLERRV